MGDAESVIKCAVCQKDMEDGDGFIAEGGLFRIGCSGNARRDYRQRQAGPYTLNHDYYICYECVLRAMGVKPDGE